jgi:DNA topoisomerase-1
MKQLYHNGVLVLHKHEGKGMTLQVKGEKIRLTPEQEEMALAWTKKLGTPYVEDTVFSQNFHRDFSKKLGITVNPGDVDYSAVLSIVETERSWKANLSREEKREMAAQRKAQREVNKKHYGYAFVDGVQIEVANYAVEPSSIFIGRGKHPLRGRWKEGPCEKDVELNLSPDAPRPRGSWKGIIWKPDAMWIARWRDKLTGKTKYVWFSDSSTLKQRKDVEKFNKAAELRKKLVLIQRHILKNLNADDLRRRKTATVCFLIDKLKIRVGDEKDPDEADTVGASTLRQEHIHHNGDGTVTFNFLGKDSIRHILSVELPESVVRNLKEFGVNAKSTLFDGVRSKHVSEFLDEVMTGLSAKVFRTCYASEAVETKLENTHVEIKDPQYVKKHIATVANLEAAKVCNHRRTIPRSWESSLEKKKVRLKALDDRAKNAQDKLRRMVREREERCRDRLKKQEEKLKTFKQNLKVYQHELADRSQHGKPVRALERRVRLQRETVVRQKQRIKMLKTKNIEQIEKARQRLKSRRRRDKIAVEKLKLRIHTQKETRDYNLATSLKSYINPRIYYEWGKQIEYDWRLYYPKTLQRKFSWVEADGTSPEDG